MSECERGSPADDGKRHLGLVPCRGKGRALAGEWGQRPHKGGGSRPSGTSRDPRREWANTAIAQYHELPCSKRRKNHLFPLTMPRIYAVFQLLQSAKTEKNKGGHIFYESSQRT